MPRQKYTKEILSPLIIQSNSLAELARSLRLIPSGGTYTHLKHLISKFNLDVSHWTGQRWNKGKSVKEYYEYKKPAFLKKKLISIRGHVCEICGLSTWLNKEIKLELHHISNKSNELDNLQLLCPNCHSYTDNYRGRAKK